MCQFLWCCSILRPILGALIPPWDYTIELLQLQANVRGFLLAAVMIHERSQAGTCGHNYGSRMQNTYLAKNEFMVVNPGNFSGIILGPHVEQLVIGTL